MRILGHARTTTSQLGRTGKNSHYTFFSPEPKSGQFERSFEITYRLW